MRRVLVTGSAGFIGRWVCEALTERGIEPVRFDRPQTVLSIDALSEVMWRTDGVINLAGMLGTSETFGAEARVAEVNVIGAINVFDAAKLAGVPVVQIGTGHKGQPNPYAITKACAEDIGLARARYLDERIVVVRAYHVYGEGQPPCAPHGTATVRKIIPSFVCRALTGMDIEVTGDGTQLIDLVYVQDVATTLVDALTGEPGTVLEAGTGKPVAVVQAALDVARACAPRADLWSRITFTPPRLGEPPGAIVVAEAPQCLNPWPYRLTEVIEWYRSQLP